MNDDEIEPEFKELFVEDAGIRLTRMSEQLLALERGPGKHELLTSLCREAHSLKGAAGMVGFHHFAEVAHALENPLQQLRLGQREVTPPLLDALLIGIDGLRSLATLSLSGSEAQAAAAAEDVTGRLATAQTAAGETPGPAMAESGSATSAAEPATAAPAAAATALELTNAAPAPATAEAATMQIAVRRLEEIDRLVGESAAAHLRVGQLLSDKYSEYPESVAQYRDLARLLTSLQEVTMRARMVTLSTIAPNLHRAVRDIARADDKRVRWEVEGGETEVDRKILEQLLDPLIHLVRNAVDHGIEAPAERRLTNKPAEATVRLLARQRGSEIVIAVSDDGHGIDLAKVRAAAMRAGIDATQMSDREVEHLIFTSGLSTASKVTEISGRGVGLDVVRANLEKLQGHVAVSSEPGRGTEFTITVPITLAIVECLIAESGGQRLALPMASVASLLPPNAPEQRVAGRQMLMVGDSAVQVYSLARTLELGDADDGPYIVVTGAQSNHAFRVHRLVGHRDLVIKGLGGLLPRMRTIAGAGIEPDGTIIVVLDIDGLVDSARGVVTTAPEPQAPIHMPSILVVDDAMTVRELQRSILERAGYRVRLATNGQEALTMLLKEPSNLVLTDLEMPLMDGVGLTERVRKHPSMGKTPVVILTSHDSEAERQRGLEAGANAYIIKSGFDQWRLLSLVEQLLLGGQA